jgi:hypothetical protein
MGSQRRKRAFCGHMIAIGHQVGEPNDESDVVLSNRVFPSRAPWSTY